MQSLVSFDGSHLPEDVRQRHAAYFAAAQQPDGGFPGRRGPSDLYYTGFALRGLAMLGELTVPIAERTTGFLSAQVHQPMSAADFFSLVTGSLLVELATGIDPFAKAGSNRQQAAADFFLHLRRADGGYAKTERGSSSTYQTFLVVVCNQLIDAPLDTKAIVRFIRSRQRDDGGFVEVDAIHQSGTSPTAAAIGSLRALESLDEHVLAAAAGFLAGMQMPEGGFRANTRIAVADLLSTFTGLFTLADLDAMGLVDVALLGRFVLSLEKSDGGFRPGFWDDAVDVEYTYYGLGCLALLAGVE